MTEVTVPVTLPAPARRLVVFVHGFGSSARCWSRLLELLRADPQITPHHELRPFQYPTSKVQLRLLRRIPRLGELGKGLAGFLESPALVPYRDVTLVGHSQGGLVIQSCVIDALRSGNTRLLARIRQIVMLATPNHGSGKVALLRRLFYAFFQNPQELSLRIFDPQVHEIVSEMDKSVESSRPNEPRSWPIPIYCFWGDEDDVVQEASAKGPFNNGVPLHGDHSSILHAAECDDLRYTLVADAIREPLGHANVWEIDLFEIAIKVEPLPAVAQRVITRFGAKTGQLVTDNVAQVRRAVTFSRKNQCQRPFRLRYGTRNEGFVEPAMSHPNEASDQDLQVYEDYGVRVVFDFTPQPGETFWLDAKVYKGFDPGHRDMHVHLGQREAYYKRIRLTLDLTAYLSQSYRVSVGPALYYREQDRGHDNMCRERGREAPTQAVREGDGVREWELRDVWGGIVDVVWDVEMPVPALAD